MFAVSTIWLVGNGEVRREIKSITKKNSLKELAKEESIEKKYINRKCHWFQSSN